MKKIRDPKAGIPKSFLKVQDQARVPNRRRDTDSTLMVMAIMGGVGMGVIGLLFTGQI